MPQGARVSLQSLIIAKVAGKVANMLCCRKSETKVPIKSVQQQKNYVDCEVFVIAFPTSFGLGITLKILLMLVKLCASTYLTV